MLTPTNKDLFGFELPIEVEQKEPKGAGKKILDLFKRETCFLTLWEIQEKLNHSVSQTSISARLRNLRNKYRFKVLARQRNKELNPGVWEYKVEVCQ